MDNVELNDEEESAMERAWQKVERDLAAAKKQPAEPAKAVPQPAKKPTEPQP